MRQLFKQYDEDGRGMIEKRDFERMYRHLLRCMIDKATLLMHDSLSGLSCSCAGGGGGPG